MVCSVVRPGENNHGSPRQNATKQPGAIISPIAAYREKAFIDRGCPYIVVGWQQEFVGGKNCQ